MKRVAKIILYNENKTLWQLRDNKPTIPYPNTWTLFGGRIEEGESPEDAVKRELWEEFGFETTSVEFLFSQKRDEPTQQAQDYMFAAQVPLSVTNNELHEGQKMQFFTIEELESMSNVYQPFLKIVKDFLQTKH